MKFVKLLMFLGLFFGGCGDSIATPQVDRSYSESLSVLGEHYASISGDPASHTVDVVQIFSGGNRRIDTFRGASSGELLLESRQPAVIDELIGSIQNGEPTSDRSCDLGHGPDWVLVAHDARIFRVGVIRLYSCSPDLVGVRPIGDAALIYSSEAAAFLRSHGLMTTVGMGRDR